MCGCAWVHWTTKLAVEQSVSKSCGLFSVDSVAADGLSSQNFRHWSAAESSDRLIGSGKPGHTEPSEWSATKKNEDGCQGKDASPCKVMWSQKQSGFLAHPVYLFFAYIFLFTF